MTDSLIHLEIIFLTNMLEHSISIRIICKWKKDLFANKTRGDK